jgi:hypothetical protein
MLSLLLQIFTPSFPNASDRISPLSLSLISVPISGPCLNLAVVTLANLRNLNGAINRNASSINPVSDLHLLLTDPSFPSAVKSRALIALGFGVRVN